ncbi:hypothetical protein O6H91_Y222200 [Diphasiastrum complanatum]|nr:hypothetical protein O6H91_Y222200 [Diphasiastrum complanatum]
MSRNGGAGSASPVTSKFRQAPQYSKWYCAIQRGHYAEVMRLLYADAYYLHQTGYQGRTALHAAVIGGWGEVVVEELLGMCNFGHGLESSFSKPQQSVPVGDLLDAVDDKYQQTALAMAVIIGNAKVVRTIMRAYHARDDKDDVRLDDEHEIDEWWQQRRTEERFNEQKKQRDEEQRQQFEEQERSQLRGIIQRLLKDISGSFDNAHIELLKHYCRQLRDDHNESEEYLFHMICYTDSTELRSNISESFVGSELESEFLLGLVEPERELEFDNMQWYIMQSIVEETRRTRPSLVHSLFQLQDNWGMTPLHAAVSKCNASKVCQVLELIPRDCVNARDGAGRTPLHRAAAQTMTTTKEEANETLQKLLDDPRTDVNAFFNPLQSFYPTLDDSDENLHKLREVVTPENEDFNRLQFLTALHLAVLHTHADRVQLLLKHEDMISTSFARSQVIPFSGHSRPSPSSWMPEGELGELALMTPLKMAILMEHEATLQALLQDDKVYDKGRIQNKSQSQSGVMSMSALHFAACCGYPEIVRIILDNAKFDPMVKDNGHHNALHYAADAFINHQDLLSLTNCVDLLRSYEIRSLKEGDDILKRYSKKKGCVHLLLQSDLNFIWSKGINGNTPCPGLSASAEYQTWWYEKLDNVTKDAKNQLFVAANAISVTAALVATASFIGPFQPPMNYQSDGYIHYNLLSVKIFIVFDSLSFYLAIASIMMSMIPSIPLIHGRVQSELQRTRRTVIEVAMCSLLASMMCVLISFAAATITVLPNDWKHRMLTFSIAMVGGIICLVVFQYFVRRYIKLVFYRNQIIRHSYKNQSKSVFDHVLATS